MKFWGVRLASILIAIGFCFLLDSVVRADEVLTRLTALAGLYVTLAVSLNLINGITGQFSIGHAAFYQVGAYTAGFLSVRFFQQGSLPGPVWMLLMMAAAAMGAGLAGLVVGLPSLRLRGDYLAIVTLGFGEIIRILVQNTEALGGAYGMNVQPRFDYIWLIWLLAITCVAVCRNLLKTAHGLPFLAVREDEIASSAMGVNVTRIKVSAFVMGSMFAGAAGALLAHWEGFISPSMFMMDMSFIILTMVVLGGTGSITGSVIAAVLLFYLPERLRDMGTVTGAAFVAAFLAAIVAVALIKRIQDHYHGALPKKWGFYFGAIGVGVLLQIGLAFLLRNTGLAAMQFEAAKLRMVIFAGTLIVLMLIRPQGVLAHHEFSWAFVRKLFGKRTPDKAVSA
jgi:branched-chain amino acid transport system permease protein